MPDPFLVIPTKAKVKPKDDDRGFKRNHKGTYKPNNSNRPLNFNKANSNRSDHTANKPNKNPSGLDEDVSTSDSDEMGEGSGSGEEIDSSEDEETAEAKRLRLAKQYIQRLRDGLPEDELEVDAKQIDQDIIAERLHKDALEAAKRLYYELTNQLPPASEFTLQFKKLKNQEVTTLVFDIEAGFAYTGNKTGTIEQWNLSNLNRTHVFPGSRKKTAKFKGHIDQVLCLALSHDGKYLASGGKDKRIIIWHLPTLSFKGVFAQHRDSISGLVFRRESYDLYSCSYDRSVKIWNAEDLCYVETLFGHQDKIMDISTLDFERCVTVGSRDVTLRLWKIVEQTQLVFHGGSMTEFSAPSESSEQIHQFVEGSIDKVVMLDESHFVTGGDSGSLCLWHISKRKPIQILPVTHGLSPLNNQPFGIYALAAVPYTDLLISGSCDGNLKFWKVSLGTGRRISPLFSIPLAGFINAISISTKDPNFHRAELKKGESPVYLILATVSRYPAHGRWSKVEGAREGFVRIEVTLNGLPNAFGSS